MPPTVFVNCPYDDGYREQLLHPLLFTLLWGGLDPQIASQRGDGGEQRMDKICGLIEGADYCIHDLSRARAAKAGDAQRMNMPFELGVAFGYRRFGGESAASQHWLVLVQDDGDKDAAFSDFGGMDAERHGNSPQQLVQVVRNWMRSTVGVPGILAPAAIWVHYLSFSASFYEAREFDGYSEDDIYAMPVVERLDFMREWIREAKAPPAPAV